MKCDNELYCWLLDWRKLCEERHEQWLSSKLRNSPNDPQPPTESVFSDFVGEVNDVLAKCDMP